MSIESETFHEARDRRAESSRKLIDQFRGNIYAWDYGFREGWEEAMKAKFDDRIALEKWHRSSKHVFCPCNREEACKSTCPHGNSFMSGVCMWCINKFSEMEAELNKVKPEDSKEDEDPEWFQCRYDKPWIGRCNIVAIGEFCTEHRKEKCFKCGGQATRGCDAAMGLVCGMPMCDEHTHTHI